MRQSPGDHAGPVPRRSIRAALIAGNVLLHIGCHDLVTALNAARPAADFHDFSTILDRWIPYVGWTWIIYYFGDLYVLLWGSYVVWRMPAAAFRRAVPVYSAMIITGALLQYAVPGYSPWPENGAAVQLWFHRRITADPSVCLPSMHVALSVLPACMAFHVFSSGAVKAFSAVLAGLITISTLTLKEHYALDAVAGLALGLLFYALWRPPAGAVHTAPAEAAELSPQEERRLP